MTNYISTPCSKVSSANSYLQVLKAPCGISLDGTHVLYDYSGFTSRTLTAVAGHDGAVDSTGTKSKQVGDLVSLTYNIVLTYNPDGSGDLNSITFEGIGLSALKTSKHVSAFVEINAGTFETMGKAEVFDNQLILTIPDAFTFSTGVEYTLQGEIEYSTEPTSLDLCNTFIKRNTYYTTTGIQLNSSSLLTQFTLWTPITFTLFDGTIQINTQYSFYRRFGDMIHVSIYLVFEYTDTVHSNITLEPLPVNAILNSYTNVGLEWDVNTETYLQISNTTQLNIIRVGGGTTLSTPYTVSGEIFYQGVTL